MKISYNWLKQFINTQWPAQKTAELLTDLGLEVEAIHHFTPVPGGLKGVVVGKVLTCEQHPNADRLKITTVDLGSGAPVQIVCGAPNVAKGQKVPVATVGTTLYGTEGKPWKIKKGKIRGEVSMGMICAEDELGLGTAHEGIMVLNTPHAPGTPVATVFEIENDTVFEIGLTPNRADAMGHWGVARDLRAGMIQQGEQLELITPSTSSFNIENRTLKITPEVKNSELAPRYCGVTLSGLTVKASPAWLQNRLKAIGLEPINNVVDATNYVLHDLGQPLHAFDAAKIKGNKIEVKTLPAGTQFTTLDGATRELHEEDLMICNAENPMCIAGVYGGAESGVTENTAQIFLESAYFNPVNIRKTAKRHGLATDASFRFERGVDPASCKYALLRAALLIVEVAGGSVTSEVMDIYPKKIEDHQVFFNFENADKLIGQKIPRETIKRILSSLEIKMNNITESGMGLTIPSYRNDVTREADLIEEILRVYSYNEIGFTKKLNASIAKNKPVADHRVKHRVSGLLTSLGFYEMLANSLTQSDHAPISKDFDKESQVAIINPLSQELSVMRQTMLFGMLGALSYNFNRKRNHVKLFEFGKTYRKLAHGHGENKHLSLLVSGQQTEDSWAATPKNMGYFYLKGIVTALLQAIGLGEFSETAVVSDLFAEGTTFARNKQSLVSFGAVKNTITKKFGINAEVLYADFNWDNLLAAIAPTPVAVKPVPKYPKVKRDLALLLDENIAFENLKQTALKTENKLLRDVSLFDVYTGGNLPEGKKSYALSFTLQDERKTLTDKQIDKTMKQLQQQFEKEYGATLR